MKMREIAFEGGQPPVDGYGPGGFRIRGAWHEGSLLVGPRGVEPVAMPLALAGIGPLLALADLVDVVLVGQGAEIAPLDAGVRAALEGAGLGVEIMATPPACRTYNVMLAEDRRVVAVLTAL